MDSTRRHYELILKFGSAHKRQRTCATWRRITYLLLKKLIIMKKLIFILFSLICLNKLTAQIPPNWSQVPNEFMVLYKNNTPQQRSTGTILPHHYISLSEVEKDSLLQDSSVALISNVYQQGDARLALTNELMILSSIPIQTLLNETGVVSQVQKTDSICFDDKLTVYVVTLDTKDPLVEYEKIKAHSGCKIVETNYVIQTPKPQTQSIQGRSIDCQQWALQNEAYPNYDINIEGAWNITKGEGVKIAVIDNGIDLNHFDLVANLLPGYDTTDGADGITGGNCSVVDLNTHGTLCAGIIAAEDNEIGIVGVAPHAKIIPIRGMYSVGVTDYFFNDWLIRALKKALNENVDIISNSWKAEFSPIYSTTLDLITTSGRNGKGIVVSFASGNQEQSAVAFPSDHPNVLSIGAMTRNGQRASYSNYGSELDVVAPGDTICTTYINNDYRTPSGTSIACPHVAGVVALMLSANPNLTREEVHELICRTAYKLPNYTFTNDANHPYGRWNEEVGYGLVDARAAVYAALRKRFTIVGPDSLCRSAQYYIENLPDSAYVSWIRTGLQVIGPGWIDFIDSTNVIHPIIKLRYYNCLLDTVTAVPGKNMGILSDGSYGLIPYSGPAELRPQVMYKGQQINLSKEIYVKGQQSPEITAHFSMFPEIDEAPEHLLFGMHYHFTCELFPDEEDLEWTIITAGDTITEIGIESPVIQAGRDSVFVKVFNPNTDECVDFSTKLYTTMEYIGMDFANPVDDIVDIQVAHKLPTNTMSRSVHVTEPILYEGEFEVELWDMYRGKLHTIKGQGGLIQMPLQGIASGNYVLRLIIDGKQVDSKPLMVR